MARVVVCWNRRNWNVHSRLLLEGPLPKDDISYEELLVQTDI